MPTFNEIIVTKKTDMAWDGGKATENLIPNDGDLVLTRLAAVDRRIRLLCLMSWDGPRTTTATLAAAAPPRTRFDDGSLSVLFAFGEPVTFTATVSPNSPPASPEPVTHAGDLVFDSTGGGTRSSISRKSQV